MLIRIGSNPSNDVYILTASLDLFRALVRVRASSSGLVLLADVGLPGSISSYNGPDLVPDSQVQSKQYENIGPELLLAMYMVRLRGSSSTR